MKPLSFGLVVLLLAAGEVYAQAPAARQGDSTTHGGSVITGSPTVTISGQPAARKDDLATCPIVPPEPETPPHGGGQIASGSATVFIEGKPAVRIGDTVAETGATSQIAAGSPTVMIGN